MKGFRRKYYASLLLLVSVLALSSRDTLSLLHEFAHLIPNPFHNHHHGHSHSHYGVKHNVLDHLKTKREKFAKLKSNDQETEKKQEKKGDSKQDFNKLYINNYNDFKIVAFIVPIRYFDIPTKFISFIFSPLAPPPRV